MNKSEKYKLQKRVFDALEKASTVMVGLNRNAEHSEPLHACIQDDNKTQMWFFVDKNNRVATGGKTTAQYTNSDEDLFVSIVGHLNAEEDSEVIKNLYTPIVGAFFSEGILDKDLRVVRLDIDSMEIWQQDLSMATRLKMIAGITVEPEELGQHAVIQ